MVLSKLNTCCNEYNISNKNGWCYKGKNEDGIGIT